ncbi:MAG: Tetracycline resistance protein, class B [Candidatus Heimdallarchaeota archaeon LC_2]|nr:MAG: Tetracycline resistance protein, class B [Candidatus Heimdallarchaeota archaeon LC_2]
MLLSNSGVVIIGTYLVLLMRENEISTFEIGILAIPFSFSLMISNAFFGRLSDYHGRRQFLLIGLILSSVSTIFYIFPINFWTYFLARIFNGIALGIFPSSLIGIASDNKVKLGWLSSFGSMGWAIGGLIGGIIADQYNLKFVFIFSSIMYFSAFVLSSKINVEGHKLFPKRQLQKNEEIRYNEVIKKHWIIYFTLIIRHGTANGIWIFWPIFLSEELNFSTTQIGMIQATNMITQFIFMRLIGDKINPKKMFFVGAIFSSIAFFSFTLVENFPQMILTQVILGFSWAMFYVGGLRRVEERSKESKTVATATGLFNSSISVAQIIGPFIAILFLQVSDPFTKTMLFASSITFLVTIFYGLIDLYPRNSNANLFG